MKTQRNRDRESEIRTSNKNKPLIRQNRGRKKNEIKPNGNNRGTMKMCNKTTKSIPRPPI